MTEYNIEFCSSDETTTRVLVKTKHDTWKFKKDLKVIKKAVVKSNQPSQGGAGSVTTGLFDNLKLERGFTIIGYIDNLADADGSTTTREAKRDNLITLIEGGQTFKIKWDELNGGSQNISVNVKGEFMIERFAEDTTRFKVTAPLIRGDDWGSG